MTTFLQKLDRAAERWVSIIDNQLQDATVRTITGEIFHDDVSSQCVLHDEAEQDAPLTTLPVHSPRDARKTKSTYPPLLRKASASNK